MAMSLSKLRMPKYSEIVHILAPLASKYFELGIQLELTHEQVKAVENDHKGDQSRCLHEVIHLWQQKTTSGECIWSTLAEAVSRVGGHDKLVRQLHGNVRDMADSKPKAPHYPPETERANERCVSVSDSTLQRCDSRPSESENESGYSSKSDSVQSGDSSGSEAKCFELAPGCGCTDKKPCSVYALCASGCPNPTRKRVPVLRKKAKVAATSSQGEITFEEVEYDFEDYEEETKKIQKSFGNFVCKLSRHFKTSNVDIKELTLYLKSTYPVMKPRMEELSKATHFMDFFGIVIDQACSWFNYEVIKDLILGFCTSAKLCLDEYEACFKEYAKQRLPKGMKHIEIGGGARKGGKQLVIKIDKEWGEVTFSDLDKLRGTFASILGPGIRRSDLYLADIREGCIMMTFMITEELARRSRTYLTSSQVHSLKDEGVILVKCGSLSWRAAASNNKSDVAMSEEMVQLKSFESGLLYGHYGKYNSLSRQMSPLNQKPLPVDSVITVMGAMKMGSIILISSVPDSVAEKLFPLSKEKIALLRVKDMVVFVPKDSKSVSNQVEDATKQLTCSADIRESSSEHTPTVPSGTPGELLVSHSLPTSAQLSWTPVPEDKQNNTITGYTVQVEGPDYTQETPVMDGNATSYEVSDLRPNTTYTFGVSAMTSAGTGPPISIYSTTPQGDPSLSPAPVVEVSQPIPVGPPRSLSFPTARLRRGVAIMAEFPSGEGFSQPFQSQYDFDLDHRPIQRLDKFKPMIVQLAQALKPEDVESLRFCYKHRLKASGSQMKGALEILENLEENGLFTCNNLAPLMELLRNIQRHDLVGTVKNFQSTLLNPSLSPAPVVEASQPIPVGPPRSLSFPTATHGQQLTSMPEEESLGLNDDHISEEIAGLMVTGTYSSMKSFKQGSIPPASGAYRREVQSLGAAHQPVSQSQPATISQEAIVHSYPPPQRQRHHQTALSSSRPLFQIADSTLLASEGSLQDMIPGGPDLENSLGEIKLKPLPTTMPDARENLPNLHVHLPQPIPQSPGSASYAGIKPRGASIEAASNQVPVERSISSLSDHSASTQTVLKGSPFKQDRVDWTSISTTLNDPELPEMALKPEQPEIESLVINQPNDDSHRDIQQILELDSEDKKYIKEWFEPASNFTIMVTGKIGAGKSTLLNALVNDSIFETGPSKKQVVTGPSKKQAVTNHVTEYKCEIGDVEIVVIDCPGLHDGTDNEDMYLQEIYDKIHAHGGINKFSSLSFQMSPQNQKPLPVMGSMKIKLKDIQKSIDKNSQNFLSGEFPSFKSHHGPRYEMRFVPSTFSKEKYSALYIDVARSYLNKKSKRKEQQHRMVEIPAMSITVHLSYNGVDGSFIKTGALETGVKMIYSCGDASEHPPVASFPKLVSHSELGLSEALAEGRSSLVIHVNMNVRSS